METPEKEDCHRNLSDPTEIPLSTGLEVCNLLHSLVKTRHKGALIASAFRPGDGADTPTKGTATATIARHLSHLPLSLCVFFVISQTIAATPPLLDIRWPIAIQRQVLEGGGGTVEKACL